MLNHLCSGFVKFPEEEAVFVEFLSKEVCDNSSRNVHDSFSR